MIELKREQGGKNGRVENWKARFEALRLAYKRSERGGREMTMKKEIFSLSKPVEPRSRTTMENIPTSYIIRFYDLSS